MAMQTALDYVAKAATIDGRHPNIPIYYVKPGEEQVLFKCNFLAWDSTMLPASKNRSACDDYDEPARAAPLFTSGVTHNTDSRPDKGEKKENKPNKPAEKPEEKPPKKPEIKQEVKAEIKAEVKEEVKVEIKEEFKDEIKAEVKEEVKDEIKAEVEIKVEVEVEVEVEVKEKPEIIHEVVPHVEPESKPEKAEEIPADKVGESHTNGTTPISEPKASSQSEAKRDPPKPESKPTPTKSEQKKPLVFDPKKFLVVAQLQEKLDLVKTELEKYNRQAYTFAELTAKKKPPGIDVTSLEKYLSDEEFQQVLGLTRPEYTALPVWKRVTLKKNKKLY